MCGHVYVSNNSVLYTFIYDRGYEYLSVSMYVVSMCVWVFVQIRKYVSEGVGDEYVLLFTYEINCMCPSVYLE